MTTDQAIGESCTGATRWVRAAWSLLLAALAGCASGPQALAAGVPLFEVQTKTVANVAALGGEPCAVGIGKGEDEDRWVADESTLYHCSELVFGSGTFTWNPIASGSVSLTEGAVPFGDSSGDLTEDPANLFYDVSLKRFGVGCLPVFGITSCSDFGRFVSSVGTSEYHMGQCATGGVFTIGKDCANSFSINSTGRVSVVQSDGGPGFMMFGNSPGARWIRTGGDLWQLVMDVVTDELTLKHNTTVAAHWDTSEFLGLGTTNPLARLHVVGEVMLEPIGTAPPCTAADAGSLYYDTSDALCVCTDEGAGAVWSKLAGQGTCV